MSLLALSAAKRFEPTKPAAVALIFNVAFPPRGENIRPRVYVAMATDILGKHDVIVFEDRSYKAVRRIEPRRFVLFHQRIEHFYIAPEICPDGEPWSVLVQIFVRKFVFFD